jgi:hypothetical protein
MNKLPYVLAWQQQNLKKRSISASSLYKAKPKKSRKGIVAKTKTSKTKTSKNYKKLSVGQG